METTIAAISTGLTTSGIIIVRMSGPDAVSIAEKVYRGKGKRKLSKAKSHTIHYGFIYDGDEVADEVLVSVMRAPYTYTGEDIAEINCHGGILVARKVLEILLKNGAVLAEPGEFTKRAFLNGKIDLTKAEAVIDVIDAKNQYALKAGAMQLKGAVADKVKEIREKLLDEMSYIEAALDDPEHYDLDGYGSELYEKLIPIKQETERLIKRSDYGSMLKEGIKTVIAGRPNAGKSSLLNLLSGYEKAIVTQVPGTTRDVLEENIQIGPVSLILMDTAGIRETEDIVEKIGVEKAKEVLYDADLALYLVDAAEGLHEEDKEILTSLQGHQVILLKNKTDLPGIEETPLLETPQEGIRELSFSALKGEGLDELENMILTMFENSEITANDEVVITNERQKACLRDADEALSYVFDGLSEGQSEEFLAIDLMNAYSALGKILGEDVGDDVIDRVFEKFCMGK